MDPTKLRSAERRHTQRNGRAGDVCRIEASLPDALLPGEAGAAPSADGARGRDVLLYRQPGSALCRMRWEGGARSAARWC